MDFKYVVKLKLMLQLLCLWDAWTTNTDSWSNTAVVVHPEGHWNTTTENKSQAIYGHEKVVLKLPAVC